MAEKKPQPGNGLLAKRAQEEEAPEGKMPPEGEPSMPEGEGEQPSNVTPEEQAAYERFVDNCYSLVYDKKTIGNVLKSLDATDDPKMNLANTTVMIVKRVADSARQAGQQVSTDVLMHGGAEVLEDLADLAAKMGLHSYTPDEIEGAVYIAADLYRGMAEADGTLDIEGSKRDMAKAIQADQAGQMDAIIPGASARFGAKKEPAEPEDEPPVEDEEAA
jgi:hypothetical protein